MWISRSAGVVTVAVRACFWSLVMRCSFRLAVEQLPESVEALVQHPPVSIRKGLDVLEPPRAGGAPARPSHLLGGDELGLLEDVHVLLDPGQRDAERLG